MGLIAQSNLPGDAQRKPSSDGGGPGNEKIGHRHRFLCVCPLFFIVSVGESHASRHQRMARLDRGTNLLDLSVATTFDDLLLFPNCLAPAWCSRFGFYRWRMVLPVRTALFKFEPACVGGQTLIGPMTPGLTRLQRPIPFLFLAILAGALAGNVGLLICSPSCPGICHGRVATGFIGTLSTSTPGLIPS